MRYRRSWIAAWCACALLAGRSLAWGADGATGTKPAVPAASSSTDVQALAETIDRLIAAKWEAAKVQPAEPAGDAEFLRRVTLDLAGRIPSVPEVREFLSDNRPDKRARAIERLLASPSYAKHMKNVWKLLLLPEERSDIQTQYFGTDFDAWLHRKLGENTSYDRMVREIMTAALRPKNGNQNGFFQVGQSTPTPFAFYAAKDGKPENLAASTARLFLGVRLECAQCHDHPFATWKRDQFWSYAAFFASIERVGDTEMLFQAREINDRRELSVPGTERTVQAAFLDGSEPEWRPRADARQVLADWMTSAENPYFARAGANRIWSFFFGMGLVDPVDDMGANNEPSHPELLDTLAREFAAHQFDIKFLIRAIVNSRTYQLTSAGYAPGQDDGHLYARMPVRGMTPLQLYESVVQAAGLRQEPDRPGFFFGGDSMRREFLDRFAMQDEKVTEHQTSILQALTLMNGRLLTEATNLEANGTLASLADAYFLDTPAKIETLYLAALGREPKAEELERLTLYVDRGGPTLNPKKALADVFWALLNSAEFILNH